MSLLICLSSWSSNYNLICNWYKHKLFITSMLLLILSFEIKLKQHRLQHTILAKDIHRIFNSNENLIFSSREEMKRIFLIYKEFLVAICCCVLVQGFRHDTFWGEKGLYIATFKLIYFDNRRSLTQSPLVVV
jgi:hypothetical protein